VRRAARAGEAATAERIRLLAEKIERDDRNARRGCLPSCARRSPPGVREAGSHCLQLNVTEGERQ
jgi:hypothetical protein